VTRRVPTEGGANSARSMSGQNGALWYQKGILPPEFHFVMMSCNQKEFLKPKIDAFWSLLSTLIVIMAGISRISHHKSKSNSNSKSRKKSVFFAIDHESRYLRVVVIFVHFRSFCEFSQFFLVFSNFFRLMPFFV